ncbi:aldo-keto reductase family protein [Dysgonomonas termitidis]|uniref:Uncharacterized protein n=1 Tax=Dysgonomonas termitidis TaxID=1516126 RepID=A0ABV9KVY4_9BACT
MNKRIKNTVHIQIEQMHIYSYILYDNSRYIGEGIRMYFKDNPDVTLHTLIDENNNETKAYSFRDTIEHLNLKTLQMFARFGLNGLIDEDLKNSPKKRPMGDFDRLIQKALNYNPKDKEK